MDKNYIFRQMFHGFSQLAVIIYLGCMTFCGYVIQINNLIHLGAILLLFADAAYISCKNMQNNSTLCHFAFLQLLTGWQFLLSLFERHPVSNLIANVLIPICFYQVIYFMLDFLFQSSAYRYQKGSRFLCKLTCVTAVICYFISKRVFAFAYFGQFVLSWTALFFIIAIHHKRVGFVLKSQKRELFLSGCFVLLPFICYVSVFRNKSGYLSNLGSYLIVMLSFVSIHMIVFKSHPDHGKLYVLPKKDTAILVIMGMLLTGFVVYSVRIPFVPVIIFAHMLILLIIAYNLLLYRQIAKRSKDCGNPTDRQHFYAFSLTQIKREERLKKDFSNYLHDDILQDILSVRNLVQKAGQPEIRQLLLETLDELNTSIRRQMQTYHPSLLKSLTLKENLENLLDTLTERHPAEIQLDCEDTVFLVEPYDVLIYRMIKELVTNALKHAHPGKVKVVLIQEQGRITLKVTDDGSGFETSAYVCRGHQGLASIEEQVSLLNGTITILSDKGAGTQITIAMPMKGDESYENFIGR